MQIYSPAGDVSQVPSTNHHPVQSSLNSSLISSLRIKVISVFWLKRYWCYLGLLFSTTSFKIKYHIYKFQNQNYMLPCDSSVGSLFFIFCYDFSFHSSYSNLISLISVYFVYLHVCLQIIMNQFLVQDEL